MLPADVRLGSKAEQLELSITRPLYLQ